MSDQILLEARNIKKIFPAKDGSEELEILNDVSITLHDQSLSTIVGASGSGKSTLLHILGGLDRPTSGNISFKGKNIHSYNDEELAQFRNTEIGFVFQFHHLLPEFTALENVFMPALISGGNPEEYKARAADLLQKLGVHGRENHRPAKLSGGEQQRVAVARALMNHPKILLADEPTGNLDSGNTNQMLDILLKIQSEEKVALLMVTHDLDIAAKSDHIYELKGGILLNK